MLKPDDNCFTVSTLDYSILFLYDITFCFLISVLLVILIFWQQCLLDGST